MDLLISHTLVTSKFHSLDIERTPMEQATSERMDRYLSSSYQVRDVWSTDGHETRLTCSYPIGSRPYTTNNQNLGQQWDGSL